MYALVQNNEIVKVFANPQGFTLNDNQYPADIFTKWYNAEKNSIGLYEVEYDHSNKKDEGYYINTNEQFKFENNKVISYFGTATPKQLEDVDATDEDGEPVLQDGVQVIIKGLKSQKISVIKQQASGLLSPTDWYVVRFIETGIPVPEEILQQRQAIRNKYN
jgi:hypothetical protein